MNFHYLHAYIEDSTRDDDLWSENAYILFWFKKKYFIYFSFFAIFFCNMILWN